MYFRTNMAAKIEIARRRKKERRKKKRRRRRIEERKKKKRREGEGGRRRGRKEAEMTDDQSSDHGRLGGACLTRVGIIGALVRSVNSDGRKGRK